MIHVNGDKQLPDKFQVAVIIKVNDLTNMMIPYEN
jgi:hypothetical protein